MEMVFTPTDFVAVVNQTLDYAYPVAVIEGELANLRISRGKWLYFDIKDDMASVKCFGTVYMLPAPLEDGMTVRVRASPRLHPLYNFSLNIQSITPVGEGSLKKAADLLKAKLQKEGLFDPSRKRGLPFAPETVGLVASKESAAYADFVKILNERWGGVRVIHHDAQVQGEAAVADIVKAIETINQLPEPPEVIVITRGGGSADDLAAFNAEQVVRAVAASRVPTLVAIGHEIDISLAELAADQRASTPSNAAQLLVPDKLEALRSLTGLKEALAQSLKRQIENKTTALKESKKDLWRLLEQAYLVTQQTLNRQTDLLEALNPNAALKRGYAVIRTGAKAVKSIKTLRPNQQISLQMHDGSAEATVNKVE